MRLRFFLQEYPGWNGEPSTVTPAIECIDKDSQIGSLVSAASLDWYQWRHQTSVESFRSLLKKKEPWSLWLQLVYFSGDEREVRLARSPHHLEELGEFGTLSVRQFSAILEDYFRFMEDQVEFERTY